MSDLSWLNPTPHAIAVYASQPLSPVATQHSLPSGRYSLTWAGLPPAGSHQLCLAHSFDHLVSAREQGWRHFEAERLGGLEIDYQLEFGRQIDRKLARFRPFEDFVHIGGRTAVRIRDARAVTDQSA